MLGWALYFGGRGLEARHGFAPEMVSPEKNLARGVGGRAESLLILLTAARKDCVNALVKPLYYSPCGHNVSPLT